MTAPSVDGHAQGIPSGTNTFTTAALTTTGAGLVCLAIVNEKTGPVTVTGITGGGLLWGLAAGPSGNCRISATSVGGTDVDLELWSAVSSGALTAQTFAVALSANTDDTSYYLFGVKGLASTADPFDSTGGPYTAFSSTSVGSITWSTTQTDDMVLWFGGGRDAHAGNAGVTNFPSGGGITEVTNTGGTLFSQLNVEDGYTSAAQGSTVSAAVTGYRGVGMIIALTGNPKGVKLQTFVTTICT